MDEFNDNYSRDLSILARVEELRNKVSQYQSELTAIESRQAALSVGSSEWKKVESARIIAAARLLHHQFLCASLMEGRLIGTEHNNKPLTAESPPEDFIAREIDLSEKRFGMRVMDANSLPFDSIYETSNDPPMSNNTGCMITFIILAVVFALGMLAASC